MGGVHLRVEGVGHVPAARGFGQVAVESDAKAGEKRRAEGILDAPAKCPLVLLNETFSTTDEAKSRRETEALAERLLRRGVLGLYVTHTAGVAVPGAGSLVCETVGRERTYRIVRADNTDGARAVDLIEKYGLTPDKLRYYERVGVIPEVTRTAGGRRDYRAEDIQWVEKAVCMRDAGVPIEILIEYVRLCRRGDETIEARANLVK